jgi:hypothetical protein
MQDEQQSSLHDLCLLLLSLELWLSWLFSQHDILDSDLQQFSFEA